VLENKKHFRPIYRD